MLEVVGLNKHPAFWPVFDGVKLIDLLDMRHLNLKFD